MLLFDKKRCVDICLLNKNKYVRLAAEDLARDIARISCAGLVPRFTDKISEGCIVIEENRVTDEDPLSYESFVIEVKENRLTVSADGYLGTMWGIYTVCERLLSVDPCYLFNDLEKEPLARLEIPDQRIEDAPRGFGLRGVFINDEDLLTGWRDGGGIRKLDFPWYTLTVEETVMRMVVETVLRLRLNLIIPASFLDIDNPPEKLLLDICAERGIYVSQHHIEPLGVSAFTFKNYLEKHQKSGEFSYKKDPKLMEEAWEYYAKKWAKYENVVWQIGLRGEGDRPVWQEKSPTEDELSEAGAFISRAYEKQREIVMRVTDGKAKHFTSTLWMEGSLLSEKGYLSFPKDTVIVFADTGLTQMFGKEYYSLKRKSDTKYGIYYHLQYFDSGPHLAPQTDMDKLLYNMKLAYEKNDTAYFIMNISNIREFTFELSAYARIAFCTEGFSRDGYFDGYCEKFSEHKEKARALIEAYYKNLPSVDPLYVKEHNHAKYFNFFLEEVSPLFSNHTLKEGDILGYGDYVLYCFFRSLGEREKSCKAYFDALTEAIPKYEQLFDAFDSLAEMLPKNLKIHVRCKWLLYVKTLVSVYKWYIFVYKSREFCLNGNSKGMKTSLNEACKALEEYLDFRRIAEYGIFENWYRGDLKMNVKQHLYDTKRRLCQTPNFGFEKC